MQKAILAKKIGMTQVFTENGTLVPVTVLEAGPWVVIQNNTVENDGYDALKVGFQDAVEKRVIKPKMGEFKKLNIAPKKVIKEFRLEDTSAYEVGALIEADVFVAGDKIDVTGIGKGKGFQGSIKRHGMSRGPMAHGSKYHRGTGSLSSGTTPGKVKKGKRMPGHMGAKQVTVQNLEIVRSDKEKNLILVKGAVPGSKGATLVIKNSEKA